MSIRISGAREHNLKGIDVEFGGGLTGVTGVSGSGKTSLVFDTLYHEARRRFLEVFSLGSSGLRLSPAQVRSITGLGPAIAVGQNLLNRNPNSTLSTASGLHPFLRLLYAHFGERHCPNCGQALAVFSEDEMVERLVDMTRDGAVTVRVPLVRGARGSHATLLKALVEEFGAEALYIDGARCALPVALDPAANHSIEVEIAHLGVASLPADSRQAVQQAAALGSSALAASGEGGGGREVVMARAPVCIACGTWFGDLTPVHLHTTCPSCRGAGCSQCGHTGLHPQAAFVEWQGLRFPQFLAQSVDQAAALWADADLPPSAHRLDYEISRRLGALCRVGLGYIALDRPSPTLSRGEAQRVRLAVALSSRLEDMVHVLDEPTIGLHPADVGRLLPAFRELAGPVVFVEHDRNAVADADWAIDLGPGAGREGGQLVFSGTPAALWETDTPTGRFFSLRERVRIPKPRSTPKQYLTVREASLRNLQGEDIAIPIGRLTVITGVSGSGKSTLVEDVLVESLRQGVPVGCRAIEGRVLKPILVDQSPIGRNPRSNPATYTQLAGVIRDLFAERTGLSPSHFSFNRPEGECPTCRGMGAVEVKMRYLPSTWVPCQDCEGQRFSDQVLAAGISLGNRQLGVADLYALPVAEVLSLFAQDKNLPSARQQAALRILGALHDVGLGYLELGQPSPTLSGGEAQRVKLAKYLGLKSLARHLLVLDEPSTGLHPQDVAGLLVVLDRLVRAGATIVVVEHNLDIIRAADWAIDLGPGASADGGRVLYAGPPQGLVGLRHSLTGLALEQEALVRPRADPGCLAADRSSSISIRGASAHNLQDVDVDLPKGALTVVTGVSGSGKSSLVGDVLEAEARRRFLETLSMYERQNVQEGPEAPVRELKGLGVALVVGPERRLRDRRATVGTATEISHHLAVLLAHLGERRCLQCGTMMRRVWEPPDGEAWQCPGCDARAPVAKPRHFSPSHYAAACVTCHGIGSLREPKPEKLIVRPDRPLCDGAMYSPGFFPKGYLCKPFNGGYDMVQALAGRYGFDPATTPWEEMTAEAQHAFLFGDPQPLRVLYRSRTGRTHTQRQPFPGFYGWIRDWDTGGTYTDTRICPDCGGAGLRPEYAAVSLNGHGVQLLNEMPLSRLYQVAQTLTVPQTEKEFVRSSLDTAVRRLRFLLQVGLGYLDLARQPATLSAGEAQRVKLAGLLGSGLTSLTVLLDEPSRGLHPCEVSALIEVLTALRDEGNTVIVVEHDPLLMRAADYVVDMGPGAGAAGGRVVAQGTPDQVAKADTLTGRWMRGDRNLSLDRPRRKPRAWLRIRGPRAFNLKGEDVWLPLGVRVGICGVSGSGKSTLMMDTLGRALAPRKQTTSVALEPIEPGPYEGIEGAPPRTILIDQARADVRSPANFMELNKPIHALYAESEDAQALEIDEKEIGQRCSACKGSGTIWLDMGFLPDLHTECETCHGTGYRPEAWQVRVRGVALPDLFSMTVDEAYSLLGDQPGLARSLAAMRDVGLGYLVLRQPGYALSGGEAQRLKIAKELCREAREETLYILDEPTVGQHLEDVLRLNGVLQRLVDEGHTVAVIEHHVHLLACCDWLIELGPGGGPEGGRIVAAGPPEVLAAGDTPTALYLREVLEAAR